MSEWSAIRYGRQHKVAPDGGSRCGLVRPDSAAWVDPSGQPLCRRCERWREYEHGTVRSYGAGCRCRPCTSVKSEAARMKRWEARDARATDVTDRAATHGRSAYVNHHCRCQVCVDDHRIHIQEKRTARRAARVLIDGRLVATTTTEHGRASTYLNHGCRCEMCTAAASSSRTSYREVSA